MNSPMQTEDIIDQLKSLAIERDPPKRVATLHKMPTAKADPQPQQTAKPRRRGLKAALMMSVLIGAGSAAYINDMIPAPLIAAVETQTSALMDRFATTDDAPQTVSTAPAVTQPAPVVAAPVIPSIIGSGYVVSDREITIRPDIDGRIASMPIAAGTNVVAGEPLAHLDTTNIAVDLEIAQAQLARAKAQEARAQATVAQATQDLTRISDNVARNIAPQREQDAAAQITELANLDQQIARQNVAIQQLEVTKIVTAMESYVVRAPFDGIIVERLVNVGDVVAAGPESGIAVLTDPNALTIQVDVAETNLSGIAVGQSADVALDAYPGETFTAQVTTISPKASLQKGTITVRLTFDEAPQKVLANMAAKVTFDTL